MNWLTPTNMKKYLKIGIILVAILGLGCFFLLNSARGEISKDIQTPNDIYWNYNFFATTTSQTTYATTTSATSTNITSYWDANGRKDSGYVVLAGAEKATFYFGRTGVGGNAGSSRFKIQVSKDGTNWYDYGNLNSATSTSPTGLSSHLISAATTTDLLSMDLVKNTFYAARCIVVETTDGEHFCSVSLEY